MAYPIIDSSTVKMEKVMDHLKEELALLEQAWQMQACLTELKLNTMAHQHL